MLSPTKQEVKRFLKYWAGGTLYFWVAYGIFALCYSGFHWDWLPSKIVADIIGWTSNYLVQRFWAFSDRVSLSEMQHAGRYVFIESVGFALDYLIIWGLKTVGISPYVGFFLSAGFFTVWSYLWYKYWVFPEKKVLYHASPHKDLKVIEPKRTLSKNKYIGDFVFATADKKLASMYLVTKGYEVIMEPQDDSPWVAIQAEEAEYTKQDKGGSIYEVSSRLFHKTPQADLDEFELVSNREVHPLRKTSYETSMKAMEEAGITIYFVTKDIADKLTQSKKKEEILAGLLPYTLH